MDDPQHSARAKWVETWKRAAPKLKEIHNQELVAVDTMSALKILEPAFASALRLQPIRLTSGMVIQQRLFARLRTAR